MFTDIIEITIKNWIMEYFDENLSIAFRLEGKFIDVKSLGHCLDPDSNKSAVTKFST